MMSMLTVLVLIAAALPSALSIFPVYNAYNYDRGIMFTPDGRIHQVEYASLASTHSSPLLVLSAGDARIMMVTAKRRGQDRLVELPGRNSNVVVGLSGVLSDSVALLQEIQKDCVQRFRDYGESKSSVQQVATAIGNACQMHAFGGGIRPYGSVMLVCGLDEQQGTIQMALTDPSGAVSAVPHYEDMWLVGGTKATRDRIQKQVKERVSTFNEKYENHALQRALRVAARVLVKEQLDSKSDQSSSENDVPEDVWLEAVVLSPEHGVYRLTDQQVEILLKEASQKEDV